MKTITVTVGWTRSDMANGYSSFDGWKRGASQHTETITFEVPEHYTDEAICDVVFVATNAPAVPENTPAGKALAALDATGYDGRGAHYTLSTGDTVTIGGKRYSCETLGWRLAELMADLTDEELIALTRDPDPVTARLAELTYAERDPDDNVRMFRKEASEE